MKQFLLNNVLNRFSKDSNIIIKNLSYLTLMRFFNIGFKFLIVAYLIRVIGERSYGILTWLDSVIQYFLMLINFGFNIYAAKYIVEYRNNTNKIHEVVSSIIIIKSILFITSCIIVYFLALQSGFKDYEDLFFLFIFIGVGEALFPVWFYQGVENLKPATVIVFFSRLFLIIGTILFVNSESDSIYYVLMLVLSSSAMGVFGLYYIIKKYQIKLIRVPISKLLFFAKESFPFFAGRFLSLVFNFGTIFLIGKFCDFEQVAGFDLSLKVIMVGVIPFEMLQQAVFPTLTRTKNKKLLVKLIKGAILFGALVGALIYLFSGQIILLFGGDEMLVYVKVLKTLTIMAPFVALTFILGSCSLVAFGHFKEYNFSLIATSIIYFIIVLTLYFIGEINFWNLIYLRIFADVLMSLIRLFYSFKKKVFTL
jgi:PST family polysaccharide transporter